MANVAGLFITGTDTGVGKTWVSVALIKCLKDRGFTTLGMKPVASGCYRNPRGLRNQDALLLQANGSFPVDYSLINPYAFEPHIAPHIAACQAGVTIDLARIKDGYDCLRGQAEWVVVEGVGGWAVPLTDRQSVSDLAALLGLPVVLVVGLRLGCLNHALLTIESICHSKCIFTGWVANQTDPDFSFVSKNIDTLRKKIPAPLIGVVPYLGDAKPVAIAEFLNLPECWLE